jgi:hypothetical protein
MSVGEEPLVCIQELKSSVVMFLIYEVPSRQRGAKQRTEGRRVVMKIIKCPNYHFTTIACENKKVY